MRSSSARKLQRRCPARGRSRRRGHACRSFMPIRVAARERLARSCSICASVARCRTSGQGARRVRLLRAPRHRRADRSSQRRAARGALPDVDAATAPFLMAALQVYWVDLASRLAADDVAGASTCRASARSAARCPSRASCAPTRDRRLSLSALRPVRDRMAHGARHVQSTARRRRALPITRSKAVRTRSAPSPAMRAGRIARSSIRRRTAASSPSRTISPASRSIC